MSGWVIRVYDPARANGTPNWIEHFDVEAYEGRGSVKLTADPAKALRFATSSSALMAWHTQSKSRPVRDDGRPNRPLTAFTAEIEPAP